MTTVYNLFESNGSYDSFSYNLLGVFSSKEKAEAVKLKLEAKLTKFKEDFPQPKEEDFKAASNTEDESWWEEFNEVESKWWKDVLANGVDHLIELNGYDITEFTIDSFTGEEELK
jgi:hypothetical protein